MFAIRNNLMAEGAARNLGKSYDRLATSVERLSSGLRINSAKDDAAGLAVRELIRADVAALRQGSRNAMDGVSMLQGAEGALGEIDSILIRMRELAEQAATDTYSTTQKQIMQAEFDELGREITRIASTTDFNSINLMNSSTGEIKIGLARASPTRTRASRWTRPT
jgi:flagellin